MRCVGLAVLAVVACMGVAAGWGMLDALHDDREELDRIRRNQRP